MTTISQECNFTRSEARILRINLSDHIIDDDEDLIVFALRYLRANLADAFEDDCETTPLFWDCNCPENYIHRKSERICNVCLATPEEQPDSRVNEVTDAGFILPEEDDE